MSRVPRDRFNSIASAASAISARRSWSRYFTERATRQVFAAASFFEPRRCAHVNRDAEFSFQVIYQTHSREQIQRWKKIHQKIDVTVWSVVATSNAAEHLNIRGTMLVGNCEDALTVLDEEVPQRRLGLECSFHEDQFTIEDDAEARADRARPGNFLDGNVACQSGLAVL